MAKKLYTSLPSYINYDSMIELIKEIEEEKEDLEVTWNGGGGSSGAGQVFMEYLHTTSKNINSDTAGLAASMSAMVIPSFKFAKGANQCDIMIHSVAGGVESTHSHTNKLLYDRWANKIDLDKFKEIAGISLKEVFFNDKRVEVWLTGKQCGPNGIKLFDETYDLSKSAELTKIDPLKIDYNLPENIVIKYGLKDNTIKKNEMEIKDLTVNSLKTGNLEVYNSILAEGKKAEQERVTEIMEYAKYDMEKANEIMKKGYDLTKKDVAYFIEKKFNSEKIDSLEKDSEKDLDPAKKTLVKDNLTKEQAEKKAALDELAEKTGLGEYLEKK